MRAVHYAVLIAVICVLNVPARAGRLQIFSDAALTECTLSDAAPATVNIYVAEYSRDGTTGPRFDPFDCGPVATEPTTWGKVKSLYRN